MGPDVQLAVHKTAQGRPEFYWALPIGSAGSHVLIPGEVHAEVVGPFVALLLERDREDADVLLPHGYNAPSLPVDHCESSVVSWTAEVSMKRGRAQTKPAPRQHELAGRSVPRHAARRGMFRSRASLSRCSLDSGGARATRSVM